MVFAPSVTVSGTGQFVANGGSGEDGNATFGGGGGGAGGSILLYATTLALTGTLQANGGRAGMALGCGGAGGAGGPGRINVHCHVANGTACMPGASIPGFVEAIP
jgi:hypothetical protein